MDLQILRQARHLRVARRHVRLLGVCAKRAISFGTTANGCGA